MARCIRIGVPDQIDGETISSEDKLERLKKITEDAIEEVRKTPPYSDLKLNVHFPRDSYGHWSARRGSRYRRGYNGSVGDGDIYILNFETVNPGHGDTWKLRRFYAELG